MSLRSKIYSSKQYLCLTHLTRSAASPLRMPHSASASRSEPAGKFYPDSCITLRVLHSSKINSPTRFHSQYWTLQHIYSTQSLTSNYATRAFQHDGQVVCVPARKCRVERPTVLYSHHFTWQTYYLIYGNFAASMSIELTTIAIVSKVNRFAGTFSHGQDVAD